MIETRGAPFTQGWDQGRPLARFIRARVTRARQGLGWLGWRRSLREVQDGAGLLTSRFLPQHHERLQGIAEGAGVSVASLEWLAASERVGAEAGRYAGGIQARISLPRDLSSGVILRRSLPDVGGFPSVELTCGHWAGCMAGLNAEGIALVCEWDEGITSPPARLVAQELLLRSRRLETAVDHARRRGRYLGGSWSLVLAESSENAVRVEHTREGFRISSLDHKLTESDPHGGADPLASWVVWLDPAALRLRAQTPDGQILEGGGLRGIETDRHDA